MATDERVDTPHAKSGSRARPSVRSEILDRQPPQNEDAEKALLGSLLLDPMICDDVVSIVRSEDFYSDAHQRLYKHIIEMRAEGKQIDATLLVEHLAASGELEAVGDVAYLGEIAHAVPVASHAEHYAKIVKGKSTQRHLIHACTEIIHEAWDPVHEPRALLNRAEEKIFAINDEQGQDRVNSMHDVMVNTFNYIDARMENQDGDLGIGTGLHDLDDMTSGGMHPAELVILAARPSMGKTALATNIAEHVATEGRHTTLFVSLEMANLELAQRMLCGRGRIDGQKLRKNFLSTDDYDRLQGAAAELGDAPPLHRRYPQPEHQRNRGGGQTIEANNRKSRPDRDRLFAVDRAGRPPRPAPGTGLQDRAASEGDGERAGSSHPVPRPVEPPGGGKQG